MSGDIDLPALFSRVRDRLEQSRDELNAADTLNQNHGDHMVEIFQAAAEASRHAPRDLPGAMRRAAELLRDKPGNGSAQEYARGLDAFARQFDANGIGLDELVLETSKALNENFPNNESVWGTSRLLQSGPILKALAGALLGWRQASDQSREGSPGGAENLVSPSLGQLFDLGVAYYQAKQRGGSKAEVIADAAVASSPLSEPEYRARSGRIALSTLLEAMK